MVSPRPLPPTPIATSLPPAPPPTGTQSGFPPDGGPNTSSGHPQQQCMHADIDETSPATLVPCTEHTGSQRRTIFGFKKLVSGFQRAVDPYDYENKHQADEPYSETGPTARVWKTAYDEAMIVDANRVTAWTDALDVLLVFAGLFSAVVSSFVTQTFQFLQPDDGHLKNLLLNENNLILRAIANHVTSDTIPQTNLEVEFVPSLSATWVNGLFFVSLTLSLTTALIAVVTKQWIHHYTEPVQSAGTPRDRCRIRELRAQNLELWHVGGIIGLLPVLMHVALGLFFAGLIVFVRSLSHGISCFVASVVAIAVLAYFITNILPIIKPSCPYITPLTHFAYTLVAYASLLFCQMITSLFPSSTQCSAPSNASENPPPSSPVLAFRQIEHAIVKRTAINLDAGTVSRLFGSSSNYSVQIIVLQALSNIPLRAVPLIRAALDGQVLKDALRTTLLSPRFCTRQNHWDYELLLRAYLRVCPQEEMIVMLTPDEGLDKDVLPSLVGPTNDDNAGDFLGRELVNPTRAFDIDTWGHIMKAALRYNTQWMEIEEEGSEIWRMLVSFLVQEHSCICCTSEPLRTYPLGAYQGHHLMVVDHPDKVCNAAIWFHSAVSLFMQPSLSALLLHSAYPKYCKTIDFDEVPSDVCLLFALVQSPFMQSHHPTLITRIAQAIQSNIGISGYGAYLCHSNISRATFCALKNVVLTDKVCHSSRHALLSALFRSLLHDSYSFAEYRTWIDAKGVVASLVDVAFGGNVLFESRLALLSDMFEVARLVQCRLLLPELYSRICQSDWLSQADVMLFDSRIPGSGTEDRRPHTFLAAAVVDGLPLLKTCSQPAVVYDEFLHYLHEPQNLSIICRILMFADIERRNRLWKLASVILPGEWAATLDEIKDFHASEAVTRFYTPQAKMMLHPYLFGESLKYSTLDSLKIELSRFIDHISTHSRNCTCHIDEFATPSSPSATLTVNRLWQWLTR